MASNIKAYFFQGSILLTVVTFLLLFKRHVFNNDTPHQNDNQPSFGIHLRGFENPEQSINAQNGFISNNTIEIGGVKYESSACLTKYLETLPAYTSRLCSNYSHFCQSFSCLDVLTKRNVDKWRFFSNNISAEDVSYSDTLYHNLSCTEFKRSRAFIEKPLSKESENFPIAFNILFHQSARQFEILLKSIYRPQNTYCIHVDAKSSSDLFKAVENIVNCFSNVFLASKREKVIYAGYSRLQADVTCMADHLNRSVPFKYLINTVVQAFPLRTIEEMVEILKIYNGFNDIEGFHRPSWVKQRFEAFWVEDEKLSKVREIKSVKQLPPPHNLEIVKGSAYGIFSRQFVEFVIRDQRAIDFLRWSKNTYSPDEMFWPTLHHTYSNPHLHTPGAFSGYPNEKEWLAVYANWGYEPCKGKRVRSVCVNGVEDVPELIKRKEFFVNKFYYDYQPLALSCLSSWIDFKQACGVTFNSSYYRTLKFIQK